MDLNEATRSWGNFLIKPTVSDIKILLPNKNCELKLRDLILLNEITIESLNIEANTLLRIDNDDKFSHKSSSTTDSLQENDFFRTIGPKKYEQEKPQKPVDESFISFCEEFPLDRILKSYAVPDLVIESKKKKEKNVLCN